LESLHESKVADKLLEFKPPRKQMQLFDFDIFIFKNRNAFFFAMAVWFSWIYPV
jgi:hypothetical protein